MGSDKVAEEEGEDLEDEEEYDEEEDEDDDDRPRKKPRHGGFILDEAGTSPPRCRLSPLKKQTELINFVCFTSTVLNGFCVLCLDVDDEYEDEEDQWEEGAEDILEKGEEQESFFLTVYCSAVNCPKSPKISLTVFSHLNNPVSL